MKPILQLWNIVAAVILFVFLHRRLAHMSDKRLPNVLGAFVAAGILSMGLTWAFYELYPPGLAISLSRWDLAYHIGVVGIIEESAKFLAFLFAVRAGETIREPQDGIVHAAAVGITFGAIENIACIMYFDSFFIALRPILTTAGHGVYAAIWGGFYAQAVYANSFGRDPGATRNALIGVPLVAIIHGIYNAATFFYPVALFVDLLTLLGAIVLYYRLVELSPYRVYPLRQARAAVESIRRGLVFNPKSALLNRNLGLYLMHLGRYRAAAQHLRASVPRSRDPRRAQFLAAACEQSFLPRYYAKRAMRVAWARLTDEQRESYLAQLDRLVGDRDGVRDGVQAFLESAFKPRKYRKTREIAREMKVRRLERRRPAPSETTRRALESLDDEERARLRRQWGGGV